MGDRKASGPSHRIAEKRHIVQIAIILFLFYIGWQFYRFVNYFENGGGVAPPYRPPSVEAFLPISALIALKSWLTNRAFDVVHPAGLVILLSILVVSFLLKRGFCSWMCPIGAASEGLWMAGQRIFGSNLKPPRMLDRGLMLLKYLIIAFFLKVIFVDMSPAAARGFLNAPYNKIADAKMLDFWTNPSATALQITGFLAFTSLIVKNFWCRYLCPYGALLGLESRLSPLKLNRDAEKCINCGACTRACPNHIDVDRSKCVNSVECTACLSCVEHCPVDALSLKINQSKKEVSPRYYPLLLLGVFFLIIFIAKAAGHWETALTTSDYSRLIPIMNRFSH